MAKDDEGESGDEPDLPSDPRLRAKTDVAAESEKVVWDFHKEVCVLCLRIVSCTKCMTST